MVTRCKKCLKRDNCQSILWSPDIYHVDCKEFQPEKKKMLFAVCYINTETGYAKVLNLFDDLKFAEVELQQLSENICKRPSSHIHLCIRPCSFCYAKELADDILMSIVNSVAQDLLIADRGFKNGRFKKEIFEKSKRWFEFALTACRRGAAILDVLNED